ncbi:MAG: DUF424 family protein [Candidatus Micrarchaeota archaeon]
MAMYLKIHQDKEKVVAVCDADLIGKVLESDKGYLDLEKHKSFYQGELVGKPQVEKALRSFDSANLVGKEAVGVALAMGLASKDGVMYIKKTPYIQIYRF